MINKWYFCLSEASIDRAHHGWREMVYAAVNSARIHTNLKPILVFDGEENEFIDTLRKKGVEVIFHRVKFYDALVERDRTSPGYASIASGAFLRVEIPLIEQEDDYVLYTDCDVLFMQDLPTFNIYPEYFSCAPQTSKTDYLNDANSGVLVINVKKMRDTYPAFAEFIVNNLNAGWPGCDQENYRRFYAGKWDNLPLEMNWKPYWGENNNINILHWHGPKPEIILDKIIEPELTLYPAWESLYSRNKNAYQYFFERWDRYTVQSLKACYEKNSKICGFVDSVSVNGESVILTGWSYLLGNNTKANVKVTINGKEKEIKSIENTLRPDVQKAFNSAAINSGFTIKIDNPQVKGNINIVVESFDNGHKIKEHINSNKAL